MSLQLSREKSMLTWTTLISKCLIRETYERKGNNYARRQNEEKLSVFFTRTLQVAIKKTIRQIPENVFHKPAMLLSMLGALLSGV